MIYINHKIKQIISVLLILSFVLPFANFAKALDLPQAPPEVYPGGAPPSGGSGVWGWLGSAAACIGGATTGVGATVGCSGLAGKLTKFVGGKAGGLLNRGLEMGMDSIAASVKKNILNKLYQKMLDYISGEGGQVLDWGQMGTDAADEATGLLLDQIAKATINPEIDLCNPWDNFGSNNTETLSRLQIILGQKPKQEEQWSCKATNIAEAGEQFFNNFEGGWDAWLEVSTQPMANPYGQYLWAIENKTNLTNQLTEEKQNLAIGGSGFLGQEKLIAWHWLDADNKLVELNSSNCPGEIFEKYYCDCSASEDLWQTPNNVKNGQYKAKNGEILIIDDSEVVTPGSVFASAASNILMKDVRAAEAGDASVLEHYVAKLMDDVFGALTTRGIRGLSNILEKDNEDSSIDGFHITSRKEQINASVEEGAFSALKDTYEETLFSLNTILEKKTDLKLLVADVANVNDLYGKSKDFYYCAMNKCTKQEYNYCAEIYPDDFLESCGENCNKKKNTCLNEKCGHIQDLLEKSRCESNNQGACNQRVEDCLAKKILDPDCAKPDSDLANCQQEGWDYCVIPKAPGPIHDSPEVQKAYAVFTETISLKDDSVKKQKIDRVDYGGFVDDCQTDSFDSECWALLPDEKSYNDCLQGKYKTCLVQKTQGLLNIEQYMLWNKSIINCLESEQKALCSESEDNGKTIEIPSTAHYAISGYENIREFYNSFKTTKNKESEEFWQDKLVFHVSKKEKYYSSGIDGYRYINFKRKQLRDFYKMQYKITETECGDGCDIKELANVLSRNKQSRALKMDTWNNNSYKDQWDRKMRELELEKSKDDPDENKIKKLEEDLAQIEKNSGNLNKEIEGLNIIIDILQKEYDNKTNQMVELIAEIDGVARASDIDNQITEAEKYADQDFINAEKKKIENYLKLLDCSDNEKETKPTSPH